MLKVEAKIGALEKLLFLLLMIFRAEIIKKPIAELDILRRREDTITLQILLLLTLLLLDHHPMEVLFVFVVSEFALKQTNQPNHIMQKKRIG